jgi:hypothetical protein
MVLSVAALLRGGTVSPRNRRLVATLLLAIQFSGCSGWHQITVSPPQYIAEARPEEVRVTRASGEQVVLQAPLVEGDSIVGQQANFLGWLDEIRVGIDDVEGLEEKRFSASKTVLGFLLGTAALLGLSALAWASESGSL